MGLFSTPATRAPFPETIPCGVSGSRKGGRGRGMGEGTGDSGAVGTTLSPVARLSNAGGVQHSVSFLRKVQ